MATTVTLPTPWTTPIAGDAITAPSVGTPGVEPRLQPGSAYPPLLSAYTNRPFGSGKFKPVPTTMSSCPSPLMSVTAGDDQMVWPGNGRGHPGRILPSLRTTHTRPPGGYGAPT